MKEPHPKYKTQDGAGCLQRFEKIQTKKKRKEQASCKIKVKVVLLPLSIVGITKKVEKKHGTRDEIFMPIRSRTLLVLQGSSDLCLHGL